ncbi:MAG: hypothetical protein HOI25_15310 [Proteobacteria bacterium]|nr:hypothetical protein [Pseudomonadota bacterium]
MKISPTVLFFTSLAALLLAACGSTNVGDRDVGPPSRQSDERAGTRSTPLDMFGGCRYDESFSYVGNSQDPLVLDLTREDHVYLDKRCKDIETAKSLVRGLTVKGQPVAFRGTPQKSLQVGVRMRLDIGNLFLNGTARFRPLAKAELERFFTNFLEGGRRNYFLISGTEDELATARLSAIASVLKANSRSGANLYVQIEKSEITAEIQAIYVLELDSGNALQQYAGLRGVPARRFQAENFADSRGGSSSVNPSEQNQGQGIRASAIRNGAGIDFGGLPITTTKASLVGHLGEVGERKESFLSRLSIFKPAHANERQEDMGFGCIDERFKKSGFTKELVRGEADRVRASRYLPILFGTSWKGNLDGHLVGLSDVRILRDEAKPNGAPTVFVYKNYRGADQKPDLSSKGAVQGYLGPDGILYRIFFGQTAWPLRCIDLVFSQDNRGTVSYGRLYYDRLGKVASVDFRPELAQ